MTYEHSVHAAGQGSGVITIAQALEIARCADNDLADAHGREAALRDRVGAQSQRLEWVHEQMAALQARLAEAEAQRAVLVGSIENMLHIMARRGRLDDGDWSKPINQMRQALANQPPSDLVALVKAAAKWRADRLSFEMTDDDRALAGALDTLFQNQPGFRALIESEGV